MKHYISFLGLLLISFGGFAQGLQEKNDEFYLNLKSISLKSTVEIVGNYIPEKGFVAYNTNPEVVGTLIYPSVGRGVYMYDGNGWVVVKGEVLKRYNAQVGLANSVLFYDKGSVGLPSSVVEAGKYYYIRNTSRTENVEIRQVIDFGQTEPINFLLSPKEGSIMVYSDGEHWYRIK